MCSDVVLERVEETVEGIERDGGRALAVHCDVSKLAEVEALSAAANDWFRGVPNLVVNNAGVGLGGRGVGEIPIEDWEWAVGVNLWGSVHGCHVFVPQLRAAGSGGVINVCSAASFGAAPGMSPYNVTKAAALALSETLAAELYGSGVVVTAVCPTFVKTNIARDGRIHGPSASRAAMAMRWTGLSPARIARMSLDANDSGRLYVLPQIDAQILWHAKRFAPASYARALGLLHCFTSPDAAPT